MAVGRMLKLQLLGHVAIKEELKAYLRNAGVIEVTDVSLPEAEGGIDEEHQRETLVLLDKTREAETFLEEYTEKLPLLERLTWEPTETSLTESERLARDVDVRAVAERCSELQAAIRGGRDELARSGELIRSLGPWLSLDVPLETLGTARHETQFWVVPEKAAAEQLQPLQEAYPFVHFEECSRDGGRRYYAVIVPREGNAKVAEELKSLGGHSISFENQRGTPSQIVEAQGRRREEIERDMERAEAQAREMAAVREQLLVLADHYQELIGLGEVERHFYRTDRVFVLEGWIRSLDRKRLERNLRSRFEAIEVAIRDPRPGEEPPVDLVNKTLVEPYEFVTTLYGRPSYREVDPTPLLAPFFVLFFAMCLTDAGYGLTLAGLSLLVLLKFKPKGGARLLMRLLVMGGIVTAVIGLVSGGLFGIEPESLPLTLRQFILINSLDEPMKMLNIAFLAGFVHILFGMGIRMVANMRAGLVRDAIFDDLFWILFLIGLAPLGFSVILGGKVPPAVFLWSKRLSLVVAVGIFVTGGRNAGSFVGRLFKGLIKFYDIVGYFGDVLSYARLLALGLATSAIALAINGIAGMVKGLPFYTGYVAAVIVLVLGHAFNIAVNTLGAFVHSGRLQYLEFFSKFFTGGGKEFRPFSSERKYTVVRESEHQS